jgi:glycosyltransferase involved in cell wall biosynthesis
MNADRQRVCFVIPSLAGGGAERVAVQVLNALDSSRWDRSLFLFERLGPFLADVSPDIRLESADVTSRIGQWRALRRFVRKTKPDVVVAFLSYWSALTATRGAGVGAKVVFAISTPVGAFLADRDYRWSQPLNRRVFTTVMRTACARADRIIASSTGVADDLIESVGSTAARIRVVHNPVDVREVTSAAREPIDSADESRWQRPVVVAAGRLAEAKNYPLLIEAFALLRRRMPATLFILGTGDQEANLRALIAAHGLADSVHLCGFRRNPWSYIARADVFALTSHYEGFGNVLVEAMACGVPVVATRSAGTLEVITSGADGLVVDQHEPVAFANALATVIEDGALRAQMAATARQHAERYRTDTIAGDYERVLTEALA